MVAVHTEKKFREVISPSKETIDFIKSRAPIGTRDVVTRRFLESLGVQSFFLGCITLFLRIMNPPPLDKRMNNTIYITDLSQTYVKLLPRKIINTAKFVSALLWERRFFSSTSRMCQEEARRFRRE